MRLQSKQRRKDDYNNNSNDTDNNQTAFQKIHWHNKEEVTMAPHENVSTKKKKELWKMKQQTQWF